MHQTSICPQTCKGPGVCVCGQQCSHWRSRGRGAQAGFSRGRVGQPWRFQDLNGGTEGVPRRSGRRMWLQTQPSSRQPCGVAPLPSSCLPPTFASSNQSRKQMGPSPHWCQAHSQRGLQQGPQSEGRVLCPSLPAVPGRPQQGSTEAPCKTDHFLVFPQNNSAPHSTSLCVTKSHHQVSRIHHQTSCFFGVKVNFQLYQARGDSHYREAWGSRPPTPTPRPPPHKEEVTGFPAGGNKT